MSDDAYNYWVTQLGATYDSAQWKATMVSNGLAPLNLRGDAFGAFVKESVQDIQDISKEIGLIK